MKIPIKTLMKQAGVKLQDVAERGHFSVYTVSRALDEDLIQDVRTQALSLIYDRSKALRDNLKDLEVVETKDGRSESAQTAG